MWGGAGPLVQYALVDLEYTDTGGDDDFLGGDGFGTGVYARAGLEVLWSPGTFVGFSLRWVDADVDVGDGLERFDVDGVQLMVTISDRR